MHQSDSLLIDYIKRKLQLEVNSSPLLAFIHQQQSFFEAKSKLWLETASIYLYSIVFSVCKQKQADLFFQLIERELQRKDITEIIEILKAFELTTDKLEKISKQYKIHTSSVALDVSFQVSILVKVLENKLEIMLMNFLESLIEQKLEADFKTSITSDSNINASPPDASKSLEYLRLKFA